MERETEDTGTERRDPQDLLHLIRCCGRYLYHHFGSGRVSQHLALHILFLEGELTQKQLQDRMEIRQGSLSELVSKLEDQQLVVRKQDPTDRRRVLLALSEKGVQQHEAHAVRRRLQAADLVSVLTPSEQEILAGLLSRLWTNWQNRLRDAGEDPDGKADCCHHRHHRNPAEGGYPGYGAEGRPPEVADDVQMPTDRKERGQS